ncbi:hypothetical protein CTEN210_05067 [Chaetoceros tenuissimus]|uniref:Uncharacterized protein n=1 Tax=Chaetoceros tenuissimus TaxID=426638 RepID=A0AAD3CP85_9STRA|nr:hypothetical protein CTEN210_05067 [Chaetoceros tenuissimus]
MPNEGTKAVDYCTIFPNTLENGKLIPIRGKPIFNQLTDLRKLLVQNAATIHTTLGGGQHGYSGLVVSPADYALLSNVPFQMPGLPPVDPVYPPAATQHQISAADRVHTEQWRRYNEAVAVEQALKKQLTEVIERIYLNQRLNNITGVLTGPLHDTMTWLLQTYGQVKYSTVVEEQAALTKYPVQVHTTLTDFFTKIDEHVPRATAAGVPLTEFQVIAIAKQAIQKNTSFQQAVMAWNARQQQPTWIAFKQFFLQQQNDLEQVLEETPAGQMFHTPTADDHQLMMQLMNMLLEQHQNPPAPTPAPPAPAPAPPALAPAPAPPTQDHSAFHAAQAAEIQQLRAAIDALQANVRRPRRPPQPMTGPRQGQPSRPIPAHFNKYCYTHGRCNHDSPGCRNKCPDHKDEATMANKMGGSTFGCS